MSTDYTNTRTVLCCIKPVYKFRHLKGVVGLLMGLFVLFIPLTNLKLNDHINML